MTTSFYSVTFGILRKFSGIFGFFALLVLASGCASVTKAPVHQWDGVSVEEIRLPHQQLEMAFDERSGLSYKISSDAENLYLNLQTSDPKARLKILRGGMEIQIDTLGGRNSHAILRFPMEENRITLFDNIPGVREPINLEKFADMQPEQINALFDEAMAAQRRKSLSGFKNHRNGRIPLDNKEGIRVILEMDSVGVLYYLAQIPLRTIVGGAMQSNTPRTIGLTVYMQGMNLPAPPMPLVATQMPIANPNRPPLSGAQRDRLNREMMRPPLPFRPTQLQQSSRLRLQFQLPAAE